jgi:hypothetical protein
MGKVWIGGRARRLDGQIGYFLKNLDQQNIHAGE